MTPARPYLLRAMHEWIIDNNMTPYMLVDAELEQVIVPREYVREGRITLNVSYIAVQNLQINNDWIEFTARFGGRPFAVSVPMYAVLAIYPKENAERCMLFPPEEYVAPTKASLSAVSDTDKQEIENDVTSASTENIETEPQTPPTTDKPRGKPFLKLVK